MNTLSLNERHIDLLNDRQIALLDNMIDVQLYDLDLEQDTDLYLELCAIKYVLGKSNNTIEGE